jgi:hypothetical protein
MRVSSWRSERIVLGRCIAAAAAAILAAAALLSCAIPAGAAPGRGSEKVAKLYFAAEGVSASVSPATGTVRIGRQ